MGDDSKSAGFTFESAEQAGTTYVSSNERIIESLKDLAFEVTEESLALMPVLKSYLKHHNSFVVRQSISSGASLFCTAMDEMILQFHRFGKVDGWLEEFWSCMINFQNAVRGIVLEPGSVATKVCAVNFLKISVLLLTSDANDNEECHKEGTRQKFTLSGSSHPMLNPSFLTSEADNVVGFLLDILQRVKTTNGSFIVTIINCLAAIARKRPVHYNHILSTFISLESNFSTKKAIHSPSIQYSLRSAFLGFLKDTHPSFIESREKLRRILFSMGFGEAADQFFRKMVKMSRNLERGVRGSHYKVDQSPDGLVLLGDVTKKSAMTSIKGSSSITNDRSSKRTRFIRSGMVSQHAEESHSFVQDSDDNNDGEFSGDGDAVKGSSTSSVLTDLQAAEQMIASIFVLLAEADKGIDSLELVISNIEPDMMANIVIENMKNIPEPTFWS